MKLIVNSFYSKNETIDNIKLISIDSSDFDNNDIQYIIGEHETPVIKYEDTGELYLIDNLYLKIKNIKEEAEIIIDSSDLVLFGGSGGGSGSQDLQSVLEEGNTYEDSDGGSFQLFGKGNEGGTYIIYPTLTGGSIFELGSSYSSMGFNNQNTGKSSSIITDGSDSTKPLKFGTFDTTGGSSLEVFIPFNIGNASIGFPAKSTGTYTLATLEDINAVGGLIPTYADNASAVTGGLAINRLYKTATGEIRVRV